MKDYSVFAEENRQEYVDVLQALTEIPSPSNKENRIAKWIRELLCGYAEKSGYDQVHIYEDDICNVYCDIRSWNQRQQGEHMFIAILCKIYF